MKAIAKPTQAVESKILASIKQRGRGAVFLPTDFLDFGSREAIDIALHRLHRKKIIRRLARGLYDYPREHLVLGLLSPSAETVAQALAGRDGTRLQPAGAYAANLLGLSDQVPAKTVFLTDGASRTVNIGTMTIQLRRTTARKMATAGRLSGLIIQALREIGKDHMTAAQCKQLKRRLPAAERRQLLKDLRYAPAWMHPIFRDLAANAS